MNQSEFKTIAAIATPPGYGGIGIIRISGCEALPLACQLLSKSTTHHFTPQQTTLQQIINPATNIVIDESLVTFFKAPHSFTGEDVVELSCHGSPVVLTEILRLLTAAGAELAQPGEFSLRAFINHRIDLTQAEAINDLIHAQTAYQARTAMRQLQGELSKQLQPIKEALVELIIWFESAVEFVEDDLGALNLADFHQRLAVICQHIESLANGYRVGRIIRSGIKLALIGRPNVGKSSLFNALLGSERAMVSLVPGTTRDVLAESLSIEGIPIKLIDTAGIRETEDIIERLGIERTRSAIAEADLVIAVVDATSTLPNEELAFIDQFVIHQCVINKLDLGFSWPEESIQHLKQKAPVLQVSSLTKQGIPELKRMIYQQAISSAQTNPEDAIITNERHYMALEQALAVLRQAEQDLIQGFTEEIPLANLHQALRQLGIVTGETLIGDIINQIFSTFCIGK